jgi:hypothetical protein
VRTHKTWEVTPGMSFSVAEDINRHVWIVEACPAGTQFWNLAQASMLTGGEKTGDPLAAAIKLGAALQAKLNAAPAPKRRSVRVAMPSVAAEVRSAERGSKSARSASRRELVNA